MLDSLFNLLVVEFDKIRSFNTFRVPETLNPLLTHSFCQSSLIKELIKLIPSLVSTDPRSWGRAEVGTWVARRGGLPERFPMNGKALCLMSKDMFASRVPHSGHALYQVGTVFYADFYLGS